MTFNLGSIDKALPHAGFYLDSQNRCFDIANVKPFYYILQTFSLSNYTHEYGESESKARVKVG